MEIKKIGVLVPGPWAMDRPGGGRDRMFGVMRDVEDRFVENGLKNITRFLSKSVEKGKMSEDQKKEESWAGSRGPPIWPT